jgi:hypothetical protein
MQRISPEHESATVLTIGYDHETQVLEVEFRGKTTNPVYRYDGVPVEVAEGLVKAESAGAFLHANIKRSYVCKKVEVASEEG